MHSRLLAITTLGPLLLATTTASAQTSTQWLLNQRQGAFSIDGVGLLTRNASTTSLVIRAAGTAPSAPTGWSAATYGAAATDHPDFSQAALLAGINRGVDIADHATVFELASMSTGGDVIPPIETASPLEGRLDMSGAPWFSLSFTVDSLDTSGVANSTLESTAAAPDSIVSYYDENSSGIEAGLIDSTVIEQTPTQLGFGASVPELIGMDWNMALISSDVSTTRGRVVAPVRDKFYFTVSRDWATANPDHVIQVATPSGTPESHALEPDHVYVMTWAASSGTYEWSAPEIAVTDVELFDERVWTKAIDALSVHEFGADGLRLIFSTDLASEDDSQFLAYQTGMTAAAVLRTSAGAFYSSEVGLKEPGTPDPDEVDSTCGRDPEAAVYNGAFGTPESYVPAHPNAPRLGLSVIIDDLTPTIGNREIHLSATGIPEGLGDTVRFVAQEYGGTGFTIVGNATIDPVTRSADLSAALSSSSGTMNVAFIAQLVDYSGATVFANSNFSVIEL